MIRSIERFTHAKIERAQLPDYQAIAAQRSASLGETLRAELLEKFNGTDSRFSARPVLKALEAEGYTAEQIAEAARSSISLPVKLACIPEVRAPQPVQPKPLAELHEGCVRLRVSVLAAAGKVAPNHIVAAISEATGISGKRIGKIQCYGDYSLVEVPQELSRRIIRDASGMPIGGVPANIRLYQESSRSSENHRPRRDGRKSDSRKSFGSHRNSGKSSGRRNKK